MPSLDVGRGGFHTIVAEGLPSPGGGALPGGGLAGWTKEEDEKLMKAIGNHGQRAWATVSCALNNRSGKACKERWMAHLSPLLRQQQWTEQEESVLLHARQTHGEAWSVVAKALPGRSEPHCKIHWENLIGSKQLAQRVDEALAASAPPQFGEGTVPPMPASMPGGRLSCDGYYNTTGLSSVTCDQEDYDEGSADIGTVSAGMRIAMDTSLPGSDDSSGDMDGGRLSAMFGPPRQNHDFFAAMQPMRTDSSCSETMEDKSPPVTLNLPTGDIIGDGTFCPEDEAFLDARPRVALQSDPGGFFDDPRFKLLVGASGLGRDAEKGETSGDAAVEDESEDTAAVDRSDGCEQATGRPTGSGLTIDVDGIGRAALGSSDELNVPSSPQISPLASSLDAALCFDTQQSGRALTAGSSTIMESHRDQGSQKALRAAQAANGLEFTGVASRSATGKTTSLRMRAPIHIGEAERAMFHRQILHKLFVQDSVPSHQRNVQQTTVKSKSRGRRR